MPVSPGLLYMFKNCVGREGYRGQGLASLKTRDGDIRAVVQWCSGMVGWCGSQASTARVRAEHSWEGGGGWGGVGVSDFAHVLGRPRLQRAHAFYA